MKNRTTGVHQEGFLASYTVRELSHPEGWGIPPVPCQGRLRVEELLWGEEENRPDSATIFVDLICESAGPDLIFNTGDEHIWKLDGPLNLVLTDALLQKPS